MKMKITRFARGAKCGNRGANTFRAPPALFPINPASAKYPNPHATDLSARRRVIAKSRHIAF
jgi:hypothetical protein